MTMWEIFNSKSLWVSMVLYHFCGLDCMVQNGKRDLVIILRHFKCQDKVTYYFHVIDYIYIWYFVVAKQLVIWSYNTGTFRSKYIWFCHMCIFLPYTIISSEQNYNLDYLFEIDIQSSSDLRLPKENSGALASKMLTINFRHVIIPIPLTIIYFKHYISVLSTLLKIVPKDLLISCDISKGFNQLNKLISNIIYIYNHMKFILQTTTADMGTNCVFGLFI